MVLFVPSVEAMKYFPTPHLGILQAAMLRNGHINHGRHPFFVCYVICKAYFEEPNDRILANSDA